MTDPPKPRPPSADGDTARRLRATRMYSDGVPAMPVAGEEKTAVDQPLMPDPADNRPSVRVRRPSETVMELPQDRAALALPEVPAEEILPVAAPPPAKRPISTVVRAARPLPPASEGQTRVGPAPAAPPANQQTAKEIKAASPPSRRWFAVVAASALAGVLAAWLAVGRDRPPAPAQQAAPAPEPAAVAAEAPARQDPVPAAPAPAAASAPAPVAAPAPATASAPAEEPPAEPVAARPPDPPRPPPAPPPRCRHYEAEVAGTAADQRAPYLALRAEPDTAAPILAQLPDGTRAHVTGHLGRWRRVTVCEPPAQGWVYVRWLKPAVRGQTLPYSAQGRQPTDNPREP